MSNYPESTGPNDPGAPWNKEERDDSWNMESVKKFAELTAKKRGLSAQLDEVKAEMDALQESILAMMGEAGVSSVRVDTDEGRFTLFPRRELWAGAMEGDYVRACVALRNAGLGDLVEERFNTQRLSAVVREMDAAGTPLPESFEGAIKVSEVFKLSVRKAGSK